MDWLAEGRTRANLRAELRAGRLISPRLGMLQVVDDADASVRHRRRVFATAPFLGPATFFSHASAAVLHGLPMLATRLTEVAVVRTGGGHGAINPTLHAAAPCWVTTRSPWSRACGDQSRSQYEIWCACRCRRVLLADGTGSRTIAAVLSGTSTGAAVVWPRALLFADPRAESAESILRRIWRRVCRCRLNKRSTRPDASGSR